MLNLGLIEGSASPWLSLIKAMERKQRCEDLPGYPKIGNNRKFPMNNYDILMNFSDLKYLS